MQHPMLYFDAVFRCYISMLHFDVVFRCYISMLYFDVTFYVTFLYYIHRLQNFVLQLPAYFLLYTHPVCAETHPPNLSITFLLVIPDFSDPLGPGAKVLTFRVLCPPATQFRIFYHTHILFARHPRLFRCCTRHPRLFRCCTSARSDLDKKCRNEKF